MVQSVISVGPLNCIFIPDETNKMHSSLHYLYHTSTLGSQVSWSLSKVTGQMAGYTCWQSIVIRHYIYSQMHFLKKNKKKNNKFFYILGHCLSCSVFNFALNSAKIMVRRLQSITLDISKIFSSIPMYSWTKAQLQCIQCIPNHLA